MIADCSLGKIKLCGNIRNAGAIQRCPLLDLVIKESLRLYPPIHIGNRRIAEEMDFDGNKVSKDDRLFYSIYLTHRESAIWENADDFCPDRFATNARHLNNLPRTWESAFDSNTL